MVLASCVLNIQWQLVSGNRSRAENSGGHPRKNDVLDCLTHGPSSFYRTALSGKKWIGSNYFAGGWTPVGCVEQKPVVDSSGKAQMQPVAQGCTLLQLPLQAANPLLSVRNWRAETVPAQRTAVTVAASNVDLIIFLLMIAPF
jgi:hypothetical protein